MTRVNLIWRVRVHAICWVVPLFPQTCTLGVKARCLLILVLTARYRASARAFHRVFAYLLCYQQYKSEFNWKELVSIPFFQFCQIFALMNYVQFSCNPRFEIKLDLICTSGGFSTFAFFSSDYVYPPKDAIPQIHRNLSKFVWISNAVWCLICFKHHKF